MIRFFIILILIFPQIVAVSAETKTMENERSSLLVGAAVSTTLELQTEISSVSKTRLRTFHQIFPSTVFWSFFVLFGLLFLYDRSFKTGLYFSMFAFGAGCANFFAFQLVMTDSPNLIPWFERAFGLMLVFMILAGMRFLYAITYEKPPLTFKIFVGAGLGLGVWMSFFPADANFAAPTFTLVSVPEGLRAWMMRPKELRRKNDGAWIIGVGALPLFLSGVNQILILLGIEILVLAFDEVPTPFYAMLSLMFATAIYLARNFAQTNQSLRQKLSEVKSLSEKTLAQEVERVKLETENARKSKELEEARALQLSMLPKQTPDLPQYEIAVDMQTASEVGGDYYDFQVCENGDLVVAVGDATGHGLNAGTMVAATKSLFNAFGDNSSPLDFLRKATVALKKMGFSRMYMGLIIARFSGKKLHVAAAGMPPILIYRATEKTVEELPIKGMPLGSFVNFPYEGSVLTLDSGDAVLFLSDGMEEMFNEKREMFGHARINALFRAVGDQAAEKIIAKLQKAASEWQGDKSQDDDTTFLVVKMQPGALNA